MKLYRITTKNNSEQLISADKVELLNSGQIVLYKNNEVISIFTADTDIVSAEDDKTHYENRLKDIMTEMHKDIHLIDEYFMTDVFLRENVVEIASVKLRKITALVYGTIDKFSSFRI